MFLAHIDIDKSYALQPKTAQPTGSETLKRVIVFVLGGPGSGKGTQVCSYLNLELETEMRLFNFTPPCLNETFRLSLLIVWIFLGPFILAWNYHDAMQHSNKPLRSWGCTATFDIQVFLVLAWRAELASLDQHSMFEVSFFANFYSAHLIVRTLTPASTWSV